MKYLPTSFLLLFASVVPVAAQSVRHEVRDGETLYSIGRAYGVSVERLVKHNEIGAPELLLPGTVLRVPGQYEVRDGDTLFSIARLHDTSVEELRKINGLNGSTIVVGQILQVPTTRRSEQSPDTAQDTSGSGPSGAEAIPVAASVIEPLAFDEGGAWPVAGNRRELQGKFPGVMIEAERGTNVASVSGGRIVYSGPHSSFGNVVFVQSPQGYIYVYGGQDSVSVDIGDQIVAGQVLGEVGVSPTEGGPALYFSVWRENRFVDPEAAPRG